MEAEEEDLKGWLDQSWVLGIQMGRRVTSPAIHPLCFHKARARLGAAVMWLADGKAQKQLGSKCRNPNRQGMRAPGGTAGG